jgi:hypothetical protein
MLIVRQIPQDLPRFGGMLVGLGFLAFGFAAIFAEGVEGRPSSTAGLAYFIVPMLALVFGALGNLAGRLVRAAIPHESFKSQSSRIAANALNVVLVVVLCGAAGAGVWTANQVEDKAEPGILVDSGTFDRSTQSQQSNPIRLATRIFSFDEKALPIAWGRNSSVPHVTDSTVEIRDEASGKRTIIPITGLDYVTGIDAVPFSVQGSARPMLALVIDGRATGHRAMAAVLGPEYDVIFLERIERSWPLDAPALEIQRDGSTDQEFIVVGPRCDKPVQLKLRRGG